MPAVRRRASRSPKSVGSRISKSANCPIAYSRRFLSLAGFVWSTIFTFSPTAFKMLKHWVVEDCGRVINPQLADEQVRGGCVQGLGGALYEHCIYDDHAQLVNGTMADYLTPMMSEMPDIDVAHIQTLTTISELGAKGVGE